MPYYTATEAASWNDVNTSGSTTPASVTFRSSKNMPENSISDQYRITLDKILCGYELEMGIRPKKETVVVESGSCSFPCFSCHKKSCKDCFPCSDCGRRYFKDEFGFKTECSGNSKYKNDIYNGLLFLLYETGSPLSKRGSKVEYCDPVPETGLKKGDVAYSYIDATAGLEIVLSPSSLDMAPKKIKRVMGYINSLVSEKFKIDLSPSSGAGFHLTFSIGRPLLQFEVDYLNQTMLKFLPAYILVGCSPYTFQRSIRYRFPTKNRIFDGYNKYHFLNGKKSGLYSRAIDLLEFRYPDSTSEIPKMLGNIILCTATILSLNRAINCIVAKTEKSWLSSYKKKLEEQLENQDNFLGFENLYRNQRCSIELLDLGNIVRRDTSVTDGNYALSRLRRYLEGEIKEIMKTEAYKIDLAGCTLDWNLSDLNPKKFTSNTKLDIPKLPVTGKRIDPLADALDELIRLTGGV